MVDEKHNAKTVEAAVFVNTVDINQIAKTVELKGLGRHAPMASKNQNAKNAETVEAAVENPIKRNGSKLHAPMEVEKQIANNVEAAVFVIMEEENHIAESVEAAVFVNMEDKNHDALNVPTSAVNMIKSK